MAGPGLTPCELRSARPQVLDVASDMARIAAPDVDPHAHDVFVPRHGTRTTKIIRGGGDGDELFHGDAGEDLINWSASFNGFGAALGTRFPTTWKQPSVVEMGEGVGDHDPFHVLASRFPNPDHRLPAGLKSKVNSR